MKTHFQVLVLIAVILVSVLITRIDFDGRPSRTDLPAVTSASNAKPAPNLAFQAATLKVPISVIGEVKVKEAPVRNWSVLDPKVVAEAVLIESLDDRFPFFYFQTYKLWPMASLTKLLTAVVVLEEIGANKKIEVTKEVIATEGNGGNFQPGEVYTALDLLKIMVITSSNDAAAAFENYYGREAFVNKLNEKAAELKMLQTRVADASGLADENVSSATDLGKLVTYILERHPEILNWSRLPSLLVQPINSVESRQLTNINPLVENKDFWGGKTGTSQAAGENLVAVFSRHNQRLLIVILGSRNRFQEIESLLAWVGQAYQFASP